MGNTDMQKDMPLLSISAALRREVAAVPQGGMRDAVFSYPWWKRGFECVFAFLALLLLFPLMLLIAIIIRLDSPGNPIFRQERVGKGERRFMLYKFRTMYVNHDDSKYKAFITKYVRDNIVSPFDEKGQDIYERVRDPRVTRFGKILRKTNLDELPQLINILKGDMSFIGPRPDIPFAVAMYQEHHKKRFAVLPGLTGLWQVSGRKRLTFEEMIALDMEYIRKQSLLLDLKIVFLTVLTILKGEGS